MTNDLEIVLCIPGKWKDRNELVVAIPQNNRYKYILGGEILLDFKTNDVFEVQIEEPDPRMREAFTISGQGRFNEQELDEIENHSLVVYLIGKGGNMADAEKIMKAGQALLNAGGLAMKVENSGKSFPKDRWDAITNHEGNEKFFAGFVILLINETGSIYSCGMHNIGMKDIICDPNIDEDKADELIGVFAHYLILENPEIKSGQTFSISAESPIFRISEEECIIYDKDALFFNPYGMFRLQPVEKNY